MLSTDINITETTYSSLF